MLEWFIDAREKNLARVAPEIVTAKVAVAADAIRSRQATAGEVEDSYNEGCQGCQNEGVGRRAMSKTQQSVAEGRESALQT